ncbi:MAG: hypothetical protein RR205_05450, partial [Oscillospiraceae bacterium]
NSCGDQLVHGVILAKQNMDIGQVTRPPTWFFFLFFPVRLLRKAEDVRADADRRLKFGIDGMV